MSFLLAAGALLRVLFLQTRSLWFDEASTLVLAGAPLAHLPTVVVTNEMNPPLYYALMHVWLKGFADPRFGLRAFSALCGIASLLAFRPLAERLLPRRARLLAFFFAAFSSYWLHAAQDGRVYACLLLVSILCIRAVWALTEAPSPRRWAAYALLCALGLPLHYYFAFPLVAHAAWLGWRFRRSPRELRRWAAAHVVIALCFVPWIGHLLWQLRAHVRDLTVGDPLTPRHLADSLGNMFFDVTFIGLALPTWLTPAIGACFAALAAASSARSFSRRGEEDDRREQGFALFHLALPIALIALAEFLVGRPLTNARYFIPLSPFAYLVAARTLSAPGRWAGSMRLAFEAVAVAGVIGYFASGRIVDSRLASLAAKIRSGSDSRMPVVFVQNFYYLPMRMYYMPERADFLISEAAEAMDYAGIPPYNGLVDASRRRRLGPCVVVDIKRLLTPRPLWLGTGAQLAELVDRAAVADSSPTRWR
ncbi:MAG: glycosyltransferase family 39 protein [Elusimicrobiota bacterium]